MEQFLYFYHCISITAIEITGTITSTRYTKHHSYMLMLTLTNYTSTVIAIATDFQCELSPLSTSKPSERIIINVNTDYLHNLSSRYLSVCVRMYEMLVHMDVCHLPIWINDLAWKFEFVVVENVKPNINQRCV